MLRILVFRGGFEHPWEVLISVEGENFISDGCFVWFAAL